jgi:hypothetical protein
MSHLATWDVLSSQVPVKTGITQIVFPLQQFEETGWNVREAWAVMHLIAFTSLMAREHQGNLQLQHNHNFREMSPISSRQLDFRLAGTH